MATLTLYILLRSREMVMLERGLSRRCFGAALGVFLLDGASGAMAGKPPVSADLALWRGLEFQDPQGGSFQIGKTVGPGASLTLLSLWAHWCPACWSEMASLAALSTALGPRGVEVLLVSHPEYWAQDVVLAQRRRVPFRLVTPSEANGRGAVRAALTQDGAYAVPRSLLFRKRDGSMAWRREGATDWASSSIVSEMRGLMVLADR